MSKRTAAATLPETHEAMIAEAAYYKAEQRGFMPGYEVADWLEAEREVEAMLLGKSKPASKKPKSKTAMASNGK
jgi:hypothetical protein